MTVRLYDKVKPKGGRTAAIVEALKEGTGYIADVELPGTDWETVEIRQEDTDGVIK